MATRINPRVWSILKEDEKLSLGLQIGNDKSTWQAGEILNKSHYKYLEISYRAKKFVRLFQEHFELYDEVIPSFIEGKKEVKKYFELCIDKRMKPGKALEEMDFEEKKGDFNQLIINQLEKWNNPEKPNEFKIFNLVKDFDRWNNFRILPVEIQEPSAFKRRIKNVYKRRVKLMGTIPRVSIDKIKEVCKASNNCSRYFYLPISSKGSWEIIKVKNNKLVLGLLTELNLYLFKEKQKAEEYIIPVHKYLNITFRECTDGLQFWPLYRELIKQAYNYNDIENITPTRKYLDLALQKVAYL